MRWWRKLCRLVACLVYCNSPLHRKNQGPKKTESNSLSIDTAALIAVMRLVCLNGFNNMRFACQDLKRESFSLTHVPGFPQPSACWRIWCKQICVQTNKKKTNAVDGCLL